MRKVSDSQTNEQTHKQINTWGKDYSHRATIKIKVSLKTFLPDRDFFIYKLFFKIGPIYIFVEKVNLETC